MNAVALIPHYRHIDTLPIVIRALQEHNLPIIVVDDGSGDAYHDALMALANERVRVVWLPQNGGKGYAVKHGLRVAQEMGYTHALQIDADAQHHFADIPRFVQAACNAPEAVICGRPVYGDDVPKARLYGRKITDFWNVVHTWSRQIRDGMCGFRLYPIAVACRVIDEEHIGNRMDFDNEILVHLYWREIALIWLDTPVRYNANGISHFHSWHDNWLITKMHTRLFFKMLARTIRGFMR